jgi:hypothetical protein
VDYKESVQFTLEKDEERAREFSLGWVDLGYEGVARTKTHRVLCTRMIGRRVRSLVWAGRGWHGEVEGAQEQDGKDSGWSTRGMIVRGLWSGGV